MNDEYWIMNNFGWTEVHTYYNAVRTTLNICVVNISFCKRQNITCRRTNITSAMPIYHCKIFILYPARSRGTFVLLTRIKNIKIIQKKCLTSWLTWCIMRRCIIMAWYVIKYFSFGEKSLKMKPSELQKMFRFRKVLLSYGRKNERSDYSLW